MAGVINTGTHPQLLWPGIYATYGQNYNKHAKEYDKLYEIKTSNKAYEKAVQVTGFGLAPVKGQGAPVQYDSETQGFQVIYSHIAYALGYIVTYEEMRDNLYEEVSRNRVESLAFSINQTIETASAFTYNNAFNPAYPQGGDGLPLISPNLVNVTGGTYSNYLNPPSDLSEPALEDMCIQIAGTQDDRGLQIAVMPVSLHIARQEEFNAHRILKSINQSGTANNDVNVLRATNAFSGGIHMNHYFTSPHAWFVRTNCPKGMTFFWRDKPEFQQDNDFDTKNAKAHTYMRFSVGCTDKRSLYGSNGP